jgi:mRNA interferase RelE/StbE
MKALFREAFLKDLGQIRDRDLRSRVGQMIKAVEAANSLDGLPHLKRLRGKGQFYRLRLGDYRVGISLEQDTVVFIRFLHRKEIYRYFP